MSYMVAVDKGGALYWFNLYNGNLKFIPITTKFLSNTSEKEYIFSHAIAKFQNLVRFEE